jgi:hypothetical protein
MKNNTHKPHDTKPLNDIEYPRNDNALLMTYRRGADRAADQNSLAALLLYLLPHA